MSSEIANTAQQEHWNAVAGPKWVGLGEAMEARLHDLNELLLAQAAPSPGEAVLDVGCGMGTTALPLAAAVRPRGRVLGIDLSEPMLSAARERVAESGIDNLDLLLADAQVYRFEPDRFDLVASRFGVVFFADPVAAFRNLATGMRPRGRLCFVCWAPLADNPHWRLPLEIVVRHLGAGSPMPPHAPGPLAFSDAAYVREIVQAAGFAEITIDAMPCAILGSTPEAEAGFASTMGPPAARIAECQPDEAVLASIREEMADAFRPFLSPSGLRLPATVFVVKARRS